MGGPVQELSDLMATIWAFTHQNNITLTARHLAGQINTRADGLSRISSKYDWVVNPLIFKELDKRWGPHTIDRFAACHNAQLPRYNSRHWDPKSAGVDAMAQQDWSVHNNYCNPPFWMIPKILNLLTVQKAQAMVIVPAWARQTWFKTLQNMSVAPPMRIRNSLRSFLKLVANPEPWKNRKWKVFAWRVCGKRN